MSSFKIDFTERKDTLILALKLCFETIERKSSLALMSKVRFSVKEDEIA